ncbi:cys/Met metabolism PLP-dependent enzyme [Hirsutella rhossiliensis]|uniref:Cys/Met metabolism PLP-dependent enzyme domain-containing protein n=1 Tax=Hirsutella rhossiliensis TaxID=111463 RepID=A0A9P8N0N7_9HYPO|nr:cys/Met metabolism PLP-dependent enzyme domain-containing protein [Hirsutella rhossiliensis]KAH0964674.1 cys/Met metabolism PLP-dependent enzyme domain-containing protein [Hirsutella rhossiliensis]
MSTKLGEPLPPGDDHAVSVSLPKWSDTVGWASRDPGVLSRLQAGYPRFYVPHIVRDLADNLLKWAAATPLRGSGKQGHVAGGQAAMLFPSQRMAEACQRYLEKRDENNVREHGPIAVIHVSFDGRATGIDSSMTCPPSPGQDVFVAMYPDQLGPEAKAFWQHTGFGISSRFAAFWLKNAPFLRQQGDEAGDGAISLRQRIAGLYSTAPNNVGVSDVYLYPTGMSAMAHTALALQSLGSHASERYRVAVFGFLYVDTFKVLSKVHGFDCVLYGHASSSDMDTLEKDLQSGVHFDALYTEFPGNPLLGSLDLDRLYALAKKYGFLVVVDDTIGTSVNLNLAPLCDVLCTSLTKMFSGACNVMGGSAVLSPQSRHHEKLRTTFSNAYLDTYFPLDVVVMDKNSADFSSRVLSASRNAERIAERLRGHRAVENVFYPKGSPTQHLYDRYKRARGEYGYLLSIRFVKPAAAIAFHDALDVAKGPSLGTNFTLCCAYTLLAHYSELEWAAKYGVVEHLVRISVGIEESGTLEGLVVKALSAAEELC